MSEQSNLINHHCRLYEFWNHRRKQDGNCLKIVIYRKIIRMFLWLVVSQSRNANGLAKQRWFPFRFTGQFRSSFRGGGKKKCSGDLNYKFRLKRRTHLPEKKLIFILVFNYTCTWPDVPGRKVNSPWISSPTHPACNNLSRRLN